MNNNIKWSMLELTGLLEDEDCRVYFQRAKRHLALHPFHLNDLNKALREILDSRVNFYDAELEGLVLAYKNPKLLSPLGGILHDSWFIHVDIVADFYIFKPEIGCILKGITNKKAENHVGVLVHKVFNVSISKPENSEEWFGNVISLGDEVRFIVTHLDFKGRLPFIRGELVVDQPMCIDGGFVEASVLNGHNETEELTKVSPTKMSQMGKAVVVSQDDTSDSDNTSKTLKKKKKIKQQELSISNDNEKLWGDESRISNISNEELSDSVVSSKKHKQKNLNSSQDKLNDIEEKSEVVSKKYSKQEIINGLTMATSTPKAEIVESVKKRSKKKISETSYEEVESDRERKPRVQESLNIEAPVKSKHKKIMNSDVDPSVNGEEENEEEDASPPKKRSKKSHRAVDSDSKENLDIELKTELLPKKKKSKKKHKEKEENENCDAAESSPAETKFIKPDHEFAVPAPTKQKQKRRKTINEDNNPSDLLEAGFFDNVVIKTEPDPSDVEDNASRETIGKSKTKSGSKKEKQQNEFATNVHIKVEPDMSDVENVKSSKKKSKKKNRDKDSLEKVKVKVEPNTSDVEDSTILKARIKTEPHKSRVKVDKSIENSEA